MVETLTYLYTSRDEIERLMSDDGLENMEDDSASSPTGTQVDRDDLETEFISEATDKINFYVQELYEASAIVNNVWVRRRATWIAAYLMTRRRANPGYYNEQYEQAVEELELIALGKRKIPRAAQRSNSIPTVSNFVMDDRFLNPLRVDPISMMGDRDSRQDLWTIYPYDTLF